MTRATSKMPKLDTAQHRRNWLDAAAGQRALYLERPVVLSPAAAAQDASNRSRMLWSWASVFIPWEYTGWMEEGRSFHDTAYIGDWTGIGKTRVKGPDAFAFLHQFGTNDLSKFGVGRMKHYVQVTEQGKITAPGVLYRLAGDEFMYTGGTSSRLYYILQRGGWKAEATIETPDFFLFAIQGPRSLDIMERTLGADFKHLSFNHFANFSLDGIPLRVLRTGVTGELGFELHGPSDHGNTIWAKVVESGQEFGIKQLGVRAQMISHVEAGIANPEYDFFPVPTERAEVSQPVPIGTGQPKPIIGSYKVTRPSELYRTPAELNWLSRVSLDSHDFIGRDALLAERSAGGPARRLVGPIWNDKDMADVGATLFQGDVVLQMEMPRYLGLEINHVVVAGKTVGSATSRTYSPFLRKMISLGHIDAEVAKPGTAVTVIWGEAGGPQRHIRGEVVNLPFKKDLRRTGVSRD